MQALYHFGFTNFDADTSLFVLNTGRIMIYLLVYVDDIIITNDNDATVQHFVTLLAQRFSFKNLGPLSFFLGVEVIPHQHGLLLSQQQYINDILTHTHMTDAKPVTTLLATNMPLSLHTGLTLFNPIKYQTIVGSLQYLSFTQPDIAFVVNKLSQFMHCPTTKHWNAVKQLLHNLC